MQNPDRRVRDEADARELIASMKATGLDARAFCAANGIKRRSLGYWIGRLPAPVDDRPSLRLAEVLVAATPHAGTAEYRLCVGDFVVTVGDDFEEETLCRLLRVVAQC